MFFEQNTLMHENTTNIELTLEHDLQSSDRQYTEVREILSLKCTLTPRTNSMITNTFLHK